MLDPTGKVIAALGGGAQKYGEIVDIAVDRAWGLYVLDKETRRLDLVSLRADRANAISIVSMASALVPNDGDTSLKNPSALGILPDGTVIVAGRGTTRVLRFP